MHPGWMRALVAATLALMVVLAAGVPHDHVRGHGATDCIACAVGQGDAARDETPDVAPATVVATTSPSRPAAAPVSGAPLGAIPGQSPPAGA
jgi:hypothetical protein